MAWQVVSEWPQPAELLAQEFWPGPLTLVLKKQATVPDLVTAGLDTVGLRMPAHPVALALIEAAQIPVAAPSANRFTQLSPTTAEHVRQSLGDRVDYILDGGPCSVGIESTVLSLAGDRPVLLRPGGISRQQIERRSDRSSSRRRLRLRHIRRRGCIHDTIVHARSCCWYTRAGYPTPVAEPTCSWGNRREGGCTKLCSCPPMSRNTPRGFIACCMSWMRTATTGLRWTLRRKLPSGRRCLTACAVRQHRKSGI